MYKRLIYDSALDWVPYVAFAVTALVFFTFLVRALSLRKERADRLSRMPLDD
ncbi:MAG: hypothetical protein IAE77_10970 [Prosthecobacter sp.]|jgi:hypothetical protein|uniref:hypothetical protein n=1 Tax=Prosthecobacter sp. TaxID=1965333 RepID=UPI001A085675|nr:hypothetical protein [Prosthecobacter sp.]MBE2283968.1 hypothetical protein [Prosthecobacter sp.]